jgi:type IV pilus assembly protein PilY1
MISHSLKKKLLLAAVMLTLVSQSGNAADIDLFAGAAPTDSDAPNVLFVIDNAANFSASVTTQRCSISAAGVVLTDGSGTGTALDKTAGAVEQCALYAAISSMNVSADTTINIGVMGFNANGMKQFNPGTNNFSSSCVGLTGGCLLMPLVPFNATNKANMLEWIRNWEISGGSDYVMKGNNTANGAVMQEAWAYFKGKTGVSGRSYAGIAPVVGCAKNTVIFIGNAYRNNSTPGDGTNEANSPLKPLLGLSRDADKRASPPATLLEKTVITDTITTSCGTKSLEITEGKGAYALNWARYMKGQDITTFSIGVLGPTCNAEYAAHLSKLGSSEVGGGKYFPTNNFEELKTAIQDAVTQIMAVNTVFAAVSLPVSVNTQGTYLNQVFIGMFRPDENSRPRWNGNLKQYKLGRIGGDLSLVDANDRDALNTLTGFISECGRSYWTPSVVDNYWSLNEDAYYWSQNDYVGCATIANSKVSNYPDGNIVEKGGQAFKLRQIVPTARNVKTCSRSFGSCTTLTDFSTSNSSVTSVLEDLEINWARGKNIAEELDKSDNVMRPSSHGDVLHSRPMPINYGTEASPNVVVYYGGNDGMLRAINGNRDSALTTSDGTVYEAGAELWSFMPPEFYSKIERLRRNWPSISYPGATSLFARAKDYGVDGPLTAHLGSSEVYLYAPMRRGGRAVYAFDVTNPASPSLLWKKGCPNASNDTDCSTGFTGIGQTWSSAKPFFASGYGSGTTPMVIMGGGYDTCEDYDAGTVGGKNHNCNTSNTGTSPAPTKGNKVYVLDAETGAVLKAFDTVRSVVADVTIVRDSSGMATYAYTADLGGNVYRITFSNGAPSSWTMTKIAALGCSTPSACTDSVANRKFMFAPSVATTDNQTYYVMLGSGDREKPVSAYAASRSVTNYFFAIQDKPSDTAWLTSENTNCGANVICLASLYGITTSATPSTLDLNGKKGWYLGLQSTEQVVTSALTIFGAVTFSTHQPAVYSATSCSANLGSTRVYTINYRNAASANGVDARYERITGDGLPPSPVGGRVRLDDGKVVNFCISCSKDGGIGVREPGSSGGASLPKGRIYWYIQK